MKIYLVCLFAVLAGGQCMAQAPCANSLKGRVLESGSGLPIEHVAVFIKGSQLGTHTDSNGHYTLGSLCPGSYVLTFQHLSHEISEEKIEIRNTVTQKNIFMHCHADSLHQLVIKGARIHWEDVTVKNIVRGNDLFLGSGLSLGKSLEKVNGVYNLSTGSNISKPVIRGMHSNRVLILNNEIRQEGQQWGNEHAPEIDQFVAKQIEVVKGPQTMRYGSDIIGGLILVNPDPMTSIKDLTGEVNLAGFSNGRGGAVSALLQGRPSRLNKWSWRLQTTYKLAGNAKTPDYFLKNTGMHEYNYSAALGYQSKRLEVEYFQSYFNTDIGIFAGSHIGNLSDLYAAFNANRPADSAGFTYRIDLPYQHVVHRLHKLKIGYELPKLGKLKLMYGYQLNRRKEFDRTLFTLQPDGSYKPALNFLLETSNYDACFQHKPFHKFEGSVGVSGSYQNNNYFGNYFIPDYRKSSGGFYLVENWHYKRFSIEAGLRYDAQRFRIQRWVNNVLSTPSHAYQGWAGSMAFRYQFPHMTLHLNLGSAWRAPFVNELYSFGVHHSAASFEIGDETLQPERSRNISLTVDLNYKNQFDGELTFFANHLTNYINLQPELPATLTIRGAFPTFRFSQTNALFYGVEYTNAFSLKRGLKVFLKANQTVARDLRKDIYLVGIPPARIGLDAEYTLFQKDNRQISFCPGASYTFRQWLVADSADYVPAPGAYLLLHADLNGEWAFGKQHFRFNLGVNNILNKRYRDYMNRNRYFANETGRNVYVRLSIPLQLYPSKK